MRVGSDIYQVKGRMGSNAWLLEEEGGVTLVDSGAPGTERPILACLQALGRDPDSILRVLLTHGHPDHYGGAYPLQRETGAPVLAHPLDTARDRRGVPRPRFHWAPGIPSPRVTGFLADGQALPVMGGLRVLHTPGHTPGSVSFHLEDRGLLFTGDTLLSTGRYFKRPFPLLPGARWSDYRASLHRLAGLGFATAFPGHGPPLYDVGRERLLEYVWLRYSQESPVWWRTVRHLPVLSRLGVRLMAARLPAGLGGGPA